MPSNKKVTVFVSIIIGIFLVLGLLWYYQSQGVIKVFPTPEERDASKILVIDRSKFKAAEGLDPKKFEEEIAKLEDLKKKVLSNLQDPVAWFNFGYAKDFLNDHEGAVAAWKKAFELQPLNFVTALNLGNVYQYFLKDPNQAEYYYKKALEIKPDYTGAYIGLMDVYRYNLKDKKSEFEPLCLAAVKNDALNAVTYYTGLVEFFVGEGNLAKARGYLAKIRDLKPASAADLEATYPALKP